MRLPVPTLAILAMVAHGMLSGCSSDPSPGGGSGGSPEAGPPDGAPFEGMDAAGGDAAGGEEVPAIGTFTVSLVPAEAWQGSPNPAYTQIEGEVDDGPFPAAFLETELQAPADATPGCAVYSVVAPNCDNIGGCQASSSNPVCAAAYASGVNSCICVADGLCEPYPSKKSIGTVTVHGIATATGATTFDLENTENSYKVGSNTTLAYPGFAENDPITISATGGEFPGFEVSAHGVGTLALLNAPFRLLREPGSTDPTRYQSLTVNWSPPGPNSTASVELEMNISRHAGTVGFLICEVEDTGSLTISGSLISQLASLGNIAGFPEMVVTRKTSESVDTARGRVELVVQASVERFVIIEGYTSCLRDTDCPAGQMCNTAKKLCQTVSCALDTDCPEGSICNATNKVCQSP